MLVADPSTDVGVTMNSKYRFPTACLHVLSALAAAGCSSYGSDPDGNPNPMGTAGTNNTAGSSGAGSVGTGNGGTGSGDTTLGGIAGGMNGGAGGVMNPNTGNGGSEMTGAGGSGDMPPLTMRPCDVYAAAGTPGVA